MEVNDDSLSQPIEYVDAICLDKNIILPEGCTTATLTTEDGEAVTLILSQHIADGSEPIKEIIESGDCDIIPEAPHDDSDVEDSDDSVAEEAKSVLAIHYPSSSKNGNDSSVHEDQDGAIHEQNFMLPNSSDIESEQSEIEETHTTTNLEDFMDVVTTYKCKFCRFSCPWKSGLVSHIRCCHIQENKKCVVAIRSDKEPNIVTATKKKDQQPVSKRKNVSFIQDVEELDYSHNSQDISSDYIQDSGNKYAKSVDTESDSDPSNRDSTILERHVFLCGQCSDGFMTLDDCKQHMIDDHNIKLDQNMIKPLNKRGRPKSRPYGSGRTGVSRTEGKAKAQKRFTRPRREIPNDRPLRCNFQGCGHRFSTDDLLQYHYACHAPVGKSFICPDCSWKFEHWRGLVMHLWREHTIDIDLLPCTDCNYRTFSYFKLENHRRIHSDERSFVCQSCGKGFKQISQLRNHLVIHMDRKNLPEKRWYSQQECTICGRKFSDTKCLRKHEQAVHSKLKPYVCSFCGHMSARKAMLDLHMRQHTGEKPFQCEHCEYRTGDHNSLRRHRMRHTGAKPYKCPHCPYACIQAISYKTHLRNKHPGMDGVYSCTLCFFKSVSKDNYVNHMADHKREGITPPDTTTDTQSSSNLNFEVIPPETSSVQMHLNNNALQQLEGILPGNITAAQLIYSCLNALSQEGGTVNLPPGVTVNLPPSTTSAGDGTQTITIQLPTSQDMENEPYYFTIQPDGTATTLVIPEDTGDEAVVAESADPEESGDMENVDFSEQDVSGASMDCNVVLQDDEEDEDGVSVEASNEDSLVIHNIEDYDDSGAFGVDVTDGLKEES